MPEIRCACPCGCRIRRSFTRAAFGLSCYPCAVGCHNLRSTGYPFPIRRHRVGITPIGLDSAGMSPDVNAAQGDRS